jgi:hypothetical protein
LNINNGSRTQGKLVHGGDETESNLDVETARRLEALRKEAGGLLPGFYVAGGGYSVLGPSKCLMTLDHIR